MYDIETTKTYALSQGVNKGSLLDILAEDFQRAIKEQKYPGEFLKQYEL